ncbi:MAG: MFS transporter [Bacteroidales bacterium]|nr:MAG: MFS transporter [Bacteroidales bacterium]
MVFKKFNRLTLSSREKKTFRLHLTYSIIEGFIAGILVLNEFVFLKSLQGSDYQIGFLFQFSVIAMALLLLFNEFIRRVGNKRKLLRITGIVTRIPLISMLFFPSGVAGITGNDWYHTLFLAVFLIYFLANLVIYPTINLLLKTNYDHPNFGELYGYATSANKVLMLVSTLLFGILLDFNNFAFVYVYPGLAMLSITSLFLLSNIDYEEPDNSEKKESFLKAVRHSSVRMVHILRFNKPYLHFEIGFMLYGFAFMSTVAVITIFFERALHLNYSSVGFYKNIYNIIAILLLPLLGRIIGKTDPRRFAIYTFTAFLLYFFFMGLTEYLPFNITWIGIKIYPVLLVAIFCNGIFAATMALLWYIGSAYFCRKEEAADYQSVHLSLTGIRAIFAPILGVFFYEMIDFSGTFLIAIFFLLSAIVLMVWSLRKYPVRKENTGNNRTT